VRTGELWAIVDRSNHVDPACNIDDMEEE
jgi:hypothetical protein